MYMLLNTLIMLYYSKVMCERLLSPFQSMIKQSIEFSWPISHRFVR